MSDEEFSVEPVSDARHPRIQGDLFLPSHPSGWGVLVLAGSSGRLDVHAARLLACTGAIALAQRWFGQPGLPAEIRDVPLELFMEGIDLLESRGCSRVALLGRSRGAEAALLVAVNDTRPRTVFALSPSSVAWAGTGLDGRPSWTFGGKGVPFVPYDLAWWDQPREGLGDSPSAHSGRAHASPAHPRGRSGRRAVAVRRICTVDRGAAPRPWADVYLLIFSLEPDDDGATAYSRMFGFGVVEDPATGNASGPLGAYLVHHKVVPPERARHLVSRQGVKMGRPSEVHVAVATSPAGITGVRIGGSAVLVAEGTLTI